MTAKEFSTKILLLLMLLLPSVTYAEGGKRDTRTNLQYDGWARLIPTHAKVQYAGGMGVISTGVGWDYGQKGQWETDVLVGYLPARYGDGSIRTTFTLRQNYIPWSLPIVQGFNIEPLACGAYLNTISGDEFWTREPSRYPGGHKGYYKFSSRTRLHLYVGQRFSLSLGESSAVKSISLYYEFSVNDLMLISRINNRTLEFSDVVHFSVGAKLHIFKE